MSGSRLAPKPNPGDQASLSAPVTAEGEKCEIVVIDSRADDQANRARFKRMLSYQTHDTERSLPSSESALALIRFFPVDQTVDSARLEIRSRHIRKTLQKYINHFPGVFWGNEVIRIIDPPYCLFHCLEDLRTEKELSLPGSPLWNHLDLVLQYVTLKFADTIAIYNDHKLQSRKDATLDYENLWTIFRPGTLVYQIGSDGTEHAAKVEQIHRDDNDEWVLTILNIELGMNGYFWRCSSPRLARYAQFKRINFLQVYPLAYHLDEETVTARLQQRGRIFASLRHGQEKLYSGVAYSHRLSESHGTPFEASGRIVIDISSCEDSQMTKDIAAFANREHNLDHVQLADGSHSAMEGNHVLSLNELMICPHSVAGYSLSLKRWCNFYVNSIKVINPSKTAFTELSLPQHHKVRLECLVNCATGDRSHTALQGIGRQSYLILLYGPPGSGKSHTIGALADLCERPCLTVNLGEFGPNFDRFQERLSDTLLQAQRWNTIIVIDNADWYFVKDHQSDLSHSAFAAILWRCIQQYPGLVFLTARQPLTSSDIQSQLTLSIQYEPLNSESRKSVWRSLLGSYGVNTESPLFGDEHTLTSLASHPLDAWQIEKVVRIANVIATSNNTDLTSDIIFRELELQRNLSIDPESSNQSISGDVDDPSAEASVPKKRKRGDESALK